AAFWGVIGFCLILAQAIYRLAALAIEPIAQGQVTESWQWGLYAGSIAFNAYAEGYRGFQRKAAPRIVVRAMHLGRNPRPLHVLFAPFFCTGLFHATRRRLIATWLLYGMLVVVIAAVRQVAQPWRGMIDAGVVVGLTWGMVAILIYYVRALAGRPPAVSPELPGDDEPGG
ncbi:MAG TPA: hypothetical protein VNO33_23425, partial [Kofleriaceae bacterium]|nr:hypothetical protein [Kofleriaceae bacterium]